MDTMFDPESMQTEKVRFLSEIYFKLAESSPELASAFALGKDVIVVHGDVTYEVIGNENQSDLINETNLIPTKSVDQNINVTPAPKSDQEPVETDASLPIPCTSSLIVAFFPMMLLILVNLKSAKRN